MNFTVYYAIVPADVTEIGCAIMATGDSECWGDNRDGQLVGVN